MFVSLNRKCNGSTTNDYSLSQSSNEVWYCKNCIASLFPFSSIDDFELYSLMNCGMPSHLESLPSFNVLSKISGIAHLDNSDIVYNFSLKGR